MSIPPSQPSLEQPRLLLRSLLPSDAPAMRELAGAREIADTTLLIPHPYPPGAAEAFIEMCQRQWEKQEGAVFGIIEKSSGQLCGTMGLQLELKHCLGRLGYWIGVPYWKRGYCTEAVEAVLRFAFETLELNRVCAEHFVRNPASGRVMQKAGMKYEGRLRQHVRKNGQFEDLECYGILRAEWTGER